MNSLLRVENLVLKDTFSTGFFSKPGEFKLGPVNFELNTGETLAIVGTNGSGKSMLAKSLVGAIKPTEGEIYLKNEKLSAEDPRQRALNIRMMFQDSNESLNPGITLGSILAEPLKLNTDLDEQQRDARIEQTLAQVGLLREHKYFYRHMLSYGQRQRVALARALILQPQVLVADEPFAALDPSVRSQTINLLTKLQRELGLGFVFISHNLGIVRHVSDHVLLLEHGQVIEAGKTETVFNWPKSDYAQKLVQAHRGLAFPT